MKPTTVIEMFALASQFDSRIKPPTREGIIAWTELLSEVPDEDMVILVKRIYSTYQLSVLQPGIVLDAWKALRASRRAEMDKNPFQPVLGSYSSIQDELEDRRKQRIEWEQKQLANIRSKEQKEMKKIGK